MAIKKATKGKLIIRLIIILIILSLVGGGAFVAIKYPDKVLEYSAKVLEYLKGKAGDIVNPKEKESPPRDPNISSSSVKKGSDIYHIDGKFIKMNDIVVYAMEKAIPEPNTVSMIGEFLYFQDEYGLVRLNTDSKVLQKMYYDMYDYCVVAPEFIYGFRNNKVIKMNSKAEETEVGAYVKGFFEIYGNHMFYEDGGNLVVHDILGDSKRKFPMDGSSITGSNIDESNVVHISTTTGAIDIDLANVGGEEASTASTSEEDNESDDEAPKGEATVEEETSDEIKEGEGNE